MLKTLKLFAQYYITVSYIRVKKILTHVIHNFIHYVTSIKAYRPTKGFSTPYQQPAPTLFATHIYKCSHATPPPLQHTLATPPHKPRQSPTYAPPQKRS